MVEAVFKCNTCKDGKTYTSTEASEHRLETGHNDWEMVEWDMNN